MPRITNRHDVPQPPSVPSFDTLPDCALVALPAVCRLYARSPASIWRDVAAGRIPAPRRVGERSTRWAVGELRQALAAL